MNQLVSETSTINSPSTDLDKLGAHADAAASLLKALSNRSRLMILCSLSKEELSVGELHQKVPLSQSALSQHLARLRTENLVKTRRESQTIYYSLYDDRASRLIAVLYEMFCSD
ncbi:MAG: ArsR/SmtB family transcription factor [Gammaproteobacteria bacterium]